MPPALQRLAVADSGRAAPHLRVHGWSPEDSLRAGEDRCREQIIPEPDGGPRHRVCGRRGYEDEIGPAGEGDVLHAARMLPPGHVRVDGGAGCDGERLFRDKAEGSFCGDGPDLVSGLSETPDHTRRLVRRDAARYPDEYAGHSSSIQRRYRRGPGVGGVQTRGSACAGVDRNGGLTRGVSTRTFFGKMQTVSYYILIRVCGLAGPST